MDPGFRRDDEGVRASRGRSISTFALAALLLATALPAKAAEDLSLSDAVVSAERRPENNRDVPLSVSLISGKSFETLNPAGEDIRVLSAQVPSLNLESTYGRVYTFFFLRGLGSTDFDFNASQPVGVMQDDVVFENPVLKSFPIFDAAQIEVLNGPQGTLFGRNTPAGVIKVTANRPTDDPEGYINASYGSRSTIDIESALSGPLIENTLLSRLSLAYQHRDDFVHNLAPDPVIRRRDYEGYDDLAGRLQFLFTPRSNVEATLNLHGRWLGGNSILFRANIIQPGTNQLVPGFRFDTIYHDGDNNAYFRSWGGSLSLDVNLGRIGLTSVTAYEHAFFYTRGDVDGGYGSLGSPPSGPGPIRISTESDAILPGLNQITQEFRYRLNNLGYWSNQGGIFLFYEEVPNDQRNYVVQTNRIDTLEREQQFSSAIGVFDTLNYQLSPDLNIGAGLRFNEDNRHYKVQRLFGGPSGPIAFKVNVSGTKPTFDLNAVYTLDDQTSLFARLATGYRPPGVQGRILYSDAISTAGAETTTSYEMGAKGTLLGGRTSYSLTGYLYETDGMQLTALGGASNLAQLVNAKRVEGYGLEGSLEVKPIKPLLLTFSGSYNHTEIQDPNLQVAACGFCTSLNRPGSVPGSVHVDGNPLPQAPQWIANVNARYTLPLAAEQNIFATTNWTYRSSVSFFLDRTVEFTGPPLLLGAFSLGFEDLRRGYEISAYVTNVANEIRPIMGFNFSSLEAIVNDPRTVGIRTRLSF